MLTSDSIRTIGTIPSFGSFGECGSLSRPDSLWKHGALPLNGSFVIHSVKVALSASPIHSKLTVLYPHSFHSRDSVLSRLFDFILGERCASAHPLIHSRVRVLSVDGIHS